MFNTVLIANRGEIALRIQRACRALGLRTVAAHSEADRDAPHVRNADIAVCIGPAPAARSYLDAAAILLAAEATGAEAIHPGYGFLSENADFAERVARGGPDLHRPERRLHPHHGRQGRGQARDAAGRRPLRAGPRRSAAGRSGRGPAHRGARSAIRSSSRRRAAAAGAACGSSARRAALPTRCRLTREEARRAFGNPAIYVEKFLDHPRHVEIQVLADGHGNARLARQPRLLAAAPPPEGAGGGAGAGSARHELVAEVGERCAEACRQIGYQGVGTFEFLFEDGVFSFIEMNTRVQVEHPVTEMTTGIDIVARGHPRRAGASALSFTQADVACRGHAFECRINAEDPETFAPSPGRITRWEMPGGPGVRIDSHVGAGDRVPPYYDSLIAKLIVHGATREEALARLRVALDETRVEGIATNLPLHRRIVDDAGFAAGGVDIHHLENVLLRGDASVTAANPASACSARARSCSRRPGETDASRRSSGSGRLRARPRPGRRCARRCPA